MRTRTGLHRADSRAAGAGRHRRVALFPALAAAAVVAIGGCGGDGGGDGGGETVNAEEWVGTACTSFEEFTSDFNLSGISEVADAKSDIILGKQSGLKTLSGLMASQGEIVGTAVSSVEQAGTPDLDQAGQQDADAFVAALKDLQANFKQAEKQYLKLDVDDPNLQKEVNKIDSSLRVNAINKAFEGLKDSSSAELSEAYEASPDCPTILI